MSLEEWGINRQRSLREGGTITKDVFEKSWDFRLQDSCLAVSIQSYYLFYTQNFWYTETGKHFKIPRKHLTLCSSKKPVGVSFTPFCALELGSGTQ